MPKWLHRAMLLLFGFFFFEFIWGWVHSEGPGVRISEPGWEIESGAGWQIASESTATQNA